MPRKRTSTRPQVGRVYAQQLYPVLGACERCPAPATDRHHEDGDTFNNALGNIAFLCASCHQRLHGDNQAKATAAAAQKKRAATHCKRGHPFSPENTYIDGDGYRVCRTCKNAAIRRWHLRRRPGP